MQDFIFGKFASHTIQLEYLDCIVPGLKNLSHRYRLLYQIDVLKKAIDGEKVPAKLGRKIKFVSFGSCSWKPSNVLHSCYEVFFFLW